MPERQACLLRKFDGNSIQPDDDLSFSSTQAMPEKAAQRGSGTRSLQLRTLRGVVAGHDRMPAIFPAMGTCTDGSVPHGGWMSLSI